MSRRFLLVLAVSLSACTADKPAVKSPADAGAEVSGAGSGGAAGGSAGTGGTAGTTDAGTMGTPDVANGGGGAQDARPEVAADVPAPRDTQGADGGDAAVTRRATFVVVVGSSTAAGFGLADPATSWVRRYATYLTADLPGSRVTNLAVSGYSTWEVQPTGTNNPAGRPRVDAAHNITAALALHPDAVIVNLPSNDAAQGVPVETSLANMQVLATAARQANVAIWMTTTQPRQLDAAGIALIVGLRDRIKQVFTTHAIDFFTPLAAPDNTPLAIYNQGDGIHPNPEGHRLLFEQVRMADIPAALASGR